MAEWGGNASGSPSPLPPAPAAAQHKGSGAATCRAGCKQGQRAPGTRQGAVRSPVTRWAPKAAFCSASATSLLDAAGRKCPPPARLRSHTTPPARRTTGRIGKKQAHRTTDQNQGCRLSQLIGSAAAHQQHPTDYEAAGGFLAQPLIPTHASDEAATQLGSACNASPGLQSCRRRPSQSSPRRGFLIFAPGVPNLQLAPGVAARTPRQDTDYLIRFQCRQLKKSASAGVTAHRRVQTAASVGTYITGDTSIRRSTAKSIGCLRALHGSIISKAATVLAVCRHTLKAPPPPAPRCRFHW